MEIKIRYTYGIPGKPETYFSEVFTIEEIESGSADAIYRSISRKIIARDFYIGLTDKNKKEIFNSDRVIYRGEIYEIFWNPDGHFSAGCECEYKEIGMSDAFAWNCEVIGNKHTEDK